MDNLGDSYIPIHPGEIVKEEFEYRGISQKHFAEVIDVSYTMLNGIMNGKHRVSAELLARMQLCYNLQVARSKTENIKKWEKIRETSEAML